MAIDHRLAAAGLVALGAIVVGIHAFTAREPVAPREAPKAEAQSSVAPARAPEPPQAPPSATTASEPAAAAGTPGAATSKPRETRRPEGHPRPASAPREAPATEGKAGAEAARESAFTHFRVGDRNVKRILVDGDTVWVGTSGGAIRYRAATDEYKLFDVRSGLLVDSVIFVGKLQGRIVAGTHGGGMALLDRESGRWENFGAAEGLADGVVHDVLQAANGDVWIATASGVNRVRGGALRQRSSWDRFTSDSTSQGLPSDRVYALAEGRGGDIWLATERGLALHRKGNWSHWSPAQNSQTARAQLAPGRAPDESTQSEAQHAKGAGGAHGSGSAANANFLVSLAIDESGNVWAGTLGAGLARFDGKAWRSYTVADGLPGNHVLALHHDPRRGLWVGTSNGLARMKKGAFQVMTTREGLFANAVFAVASAPREIWVGSYGGVARIRASN